MENQAWTSIIQEFKVNFSYEYPYINFRDYVSDTQISEFLDKNIKFDYPKIMDLFSDYVQAQGLCDVVE
tara:strand:- start:3867 stop:4073 length:207 start_codon:yes stop_codon:yes gene_type:complete